MAEAGPQFTGEAQLRALGGLEGPVRVSVASFRDEGRTHWHSHEGGQILYVTEGRGLHQVRGGEVEQFAAGDTVRVEAGVDHWHGAAPGESMSHVAVSAGATDWQEPATPA